MAGLRRILWSLLALACAWSPPAAAQESGRAEIRDEVAERLRNLRGTVQPRRGGVIGLMGYNVTPDGSANALQVETKTLATDEEGDQTLTLSQLGFGFTVSESFPLFLEAYLGYARYDPRALFTGEGARRYPLRWNNIATTIGVGYDFRLTENLWLRPIVNASAGYATSDAGLFASFINYRRDVDLSALTDAHVNVWGRGGSLTLAYYDYQPERETELELRYSHIDLQTFGDTLPAARGNSTARTLGLWGRYRWPTGREVYGRPMRWVIDGSGSLYLGDQREAIGFAWSAKLGGGIEFDTGRWELGAMGLNVNRVRFIGRYFFADDNLTGYSFGIGVSF